ncbi:mannitol dehydrogenase family protein [Sphingobacterium chungjuense]|uniref:mannitol dehydrogenase family protein n=1 Tax=Sphingobacterium chungjuense TaxID=2675553 RepID=UPI001409FEE3|nr:mannitol dehydrogenase family protein [Sphingobacterium chungjuense]
MTTKEIIHQPLGVAQTGIDRTAIKSGIVHIGVGNFHRAHQQYYTNLLLTQPDQQNWGICGIALLPTDENLVRALQAQNGWYSLTICGRDGKDDLQEINSLVEMIWGVEVPEAVIDKIASPDIKIITLTITEGGYNIDSNDGTFQIDNPTIQEDLLNLKTTKTVFGFVAAGLRQRMHAGGAGLTILSCDNLQHNGDTAKKAFTSFIKAQDKSLADWVELNVTFPNSMVDRITPVTRPEDIKWLNSKNKLDDQAPVYCEDFVQWVIEDKFIAGRPAWEKVGVEFTDDVAAFENMKLSLLNASHSLLSYPAFLSGYRKVDEAMQNIHLHQYLSDLMNIDITPYVPAPQNTDLDLYKQTLLERFAHRSVSDQVSRLCFDGISKFPVYLMPNLNKMIQDGKDLQRVAYGIATYRHYLKYKIDDKGQSYEIAEPWLLDTDRPYIESDDPLQFLDFKPFRDSFLSSSKDFKTLYLSYCTAIKEQGALEVLKTIA